MTGSPAPHHAPDSPWVQVLDTQDMDQHALAQQGWALQYEQLSPGHFKGRIHQVQLPEVRLLREDTSIALRQAAPGVTIQDMASHWGFWHLSQFAQDYKHLFGELPSDTLRQR